MPSTRRTIASEAAVTGCHHRCGCPPFGHKVLATVARASSLPSITSAPTGPPCMLRLTNPGHRPGPLKSSAFSLSIAPAGSFTSRARRRPLSNNSIALSGCRRPKFQPVGFFVIALRGVQQNRRPWARQHHSGNGNLSSKIKTTLSEVDGDKRVAGLIDFRIGDERQNKRIQQLNSRSKSETEGSSSKPLPCALNMLPPKSRVVVCKTALLGPCRRSAARRRCFQPTFPMLYGSRDAVGVLLTLLTTSFSNAALLPPRW